MEQIHSEDNTQIQPPENYQGLPAEIQQEQSENVLEFMLNKFDYQIGQTVSGTTKRSIIDNLVGKLVILNSANSKHVYQIAAVTFDKTPDNTSIVDKGKAVLLSKYFEEFYEYKWLHKKQPLLICQRYKAENTKTTNEKKRNAEVLLIPEACEWISAEGALKYSTWNNCNGNRKNQREANDLNINSEEEYNDEEEGNLSIWKYYGKRINIVRDPKTQKIKFEEDCLSLMNVGKFGNKLNHTKLGKFQWVVISSKKSKFKARAMISQIITTARSNLIDIETPKEFAFNAESPIEEQFKDYLDNNTIRFSIALFILGEEEKNNYSIIKKKLLEDLKITSQFISLDNHFTPNSQYYSSVIYQMLQKTGTISYYINFDPEIKEHWGVNTKVIVHGICFKEYKGVLNIVLTSSYDSEFIEYRWDNIEIKTPNKSNIEKGIKSLFNKSHEYYELWNDCLPDYSIIYMSTDKLTCMKEPFFDGVVSAIFNGVYNNDNKLSKGYCLISGITPEKYSETKRIERFNVVKKGKLKKDYFIVDNHLPKDTLKFLEHFTFKLTYYDYCNYKKAVTPICLKYADWGYKLIHTNQIYNVDESLRCNPFYI